MSSFTYVLTLETDCAFTSTQATSSAATLDFVPGSVLLGACASQDYPGDAEVAWRLYHSGRVRFGAGLPVHDGAMGLPTPLVFYRAKGEAGAPWRNRLVAAPSAPVESAKGDYLSATGAAFSLRRRASMRTAINEETGRAKDGQLYGLQVLEAGARFVGQVSADDPADLARIRALLAGRTIHVGRSRSAELGRARIDILDASPWLAHGPFTPGRAVFLCLSEVAPRGADGAPASLPAAGSLGLPEDWSYNPAESAVRTRSYAPFNGWRSRPDLERQVIVAGSVLVYTGRSAADPAAVQARLAHGVGEWRAEGLGQLWLNPPLLASREASPWASVRVPETKRSHLAATPPGPLGEWLTQQAAAAAQRDSRFTAAQAEARERLWRRIPKSQWGELRAIAGVRVDARALREEVEKRISEGKRRELWNGPPKDRLLAYLEGAGADAPVALELLATLAPRAQKEDR